MSAAEKLTTAENYENIDCKLQDAFQEINSWPNVNHSISRSPGAKAVRPQLHDFIHGPALYSIRVHPIWSRHHTVPRILAKDSADHLVQREGASRQAI